MGILDPREQQGEGGAAEKARARWGMAPAASLPTADQQASEPIAPAAAPSDRLHVFAYVTAENAWLYRAVMSAFMAAKQRFLLHLRPADVREALSERGLPLSLEEVDAALKQLAAWENLRADPDTADVASVEEFYRERLLYQLTRRGESAERAIRSYEELVEQPGELQSTASTGARKHSNLGELAVRRDTPRGPTHGTVHFVL